MASLIDACSAHGEAGVPILPISPPASTPSAHVAAPRLGFPSPHLVTLISKHADIWRPISEMERRKQLALPRAALNQSELVACVTHLQTEIAWLQVEITTTEHSLRAARDEAWKATRSLSARPARHRAVLPFGSPRSPAVTMEAAGESRSTRTPGTATQWRHVQDEKILDLGSNIRPLTYDSAGGRPSAAGNIRGYILLRRQPVLRRGCALAGANHAGL